MKLNEFVDRLYAMGSIDNNNRLNESFVRQWFPKNEDYFLNDLENVLNIVPVDSRHDEIEDEDQVLYEFSGTKDDFQYAVDNFGYFENLDYQKKHLDDELEYSDDISKLTYNESLNEARNPENDEVNSVIRKWANSDRNRISKRDQKVLDDAGVKLEPYFPGAKEKIVVPSEVERKPSGVFERGWGKEHIRRMHPDHDIANDVKTDREIYFGSNPYNRDKNSWDYDDHQPNKETNDEAKALRPYSREYKNLKGSVEYANEHNWHKEEAQKKLDDFRAKMAAKKNESLNLNESKEGLKDWFWSMIENNELDTETATGILLTYISDEDLLDAVEETKEYLES